MQDDLRKLKKRTGGGDDSSDSDSEDDGHKRKRRAGPSYLDQELAKYSSNRGRAAKSRSSRRAEDEDLLEEMSSFAGRVKTAARDDEAGEAPHAAEPSAANGQADEAEPLEVDDDVGWLSHALKFEKSNADQIRRAEDDYTVRNDVCPLGVYTHVQGN